jgi:hypothetical protein
MTVGISVFSGDFSPQAFVKLLAKSLGVCMGLQGFKPCQHLVHGELFLQILKVTLTNCVILGGV